MQRDLPPKYYLDHFREFIEFIESRCRHLLDIPHKDYLETFAALSEDAQCLFVRILNRKGHVVKTDTLKYDEIANIPNALTELTAKELIGPVEEDHVLVALASLTKTELIDIASMDREDLTATVPKKSQTKAVWLHWVEEQLPKSQLLQHPHLSSLIVQYQGDVFDYLLFLFFGNLKGKLNQFSLRDMGIVGSKKQQVQSEVRFMHLAEALSAYFYAKKNHTFTNNTIKELTEFATQIDEYPTPEGIIAHRAYDQFTFRLGKALLQTDHSLALEMLSRSSEPQAIEKRIREWYKLDQKEKVRSALEAIIDSPDSEHLFLFATDFLERKFHSKRTSILTDMLRDGPPPIVMDEAFINDVEIGVINHYKRHGHQAIRTENQPWLALFTLIFWPELFEHEKTGLCSEFDSQPLVIKHNRFYESIPDEINQRLATFKTKNDISAWVIKNWTAHYGKANGIFYWHERLLGTLLLIIEHSELPFLVKHMLDMSQRYNELNDGYPDIMVIDSHGMRFEEIKAPGDQLRRNQLITIQKLKRSNWDVRLQTVQWQLNPDQPYVVVDIETTGGGQGHHRITEIGMVKVLNGNIVDTWQSLINPQRHIPKYITELTGISNEMVSNAPLFSEVAEDVRTFCEGCIFVAHNVNFDYGFFKQEYERLNVTFRLPKLCTVRLAKRYLPGHESYSLGKLCKSLDIPLENHHRALDDAKAAAEILIRVNAIRIQE